MSNVNNNRIAYIDAIRDFSILCIIIIHSTAYVNKIYGSTELVTVLGNFSRFSVTLFIFLSGFCLSLNYLNKKLDIKKFFINSLLKIIPAYIVWNFIYQIYYTGSIHFNKSGLKEILLGSSGSHLYFVPVLIGLYLVFPLIWKFKDKIKYFLLFSFIIQIFSLMARFYALENNIPYAKEARAFFVLFIGFFVLGIFCAINFNRFKTYINKYYLIFIIISLFSLTLIIIIPNNITFQIYYLLTIPTIFIVFQKVSNPFFSRIAETGYYIYLMHYLILEYLVRIIHVAFMPYFIFALILSFLTFILSYFLSIIYIKIKTVIKGLILKKHEKEIDNN